MVDPLTITALVSIFGSLAGTAMKATGAAAQGREEHQQAMLNAALARQQAADARARGTYAAGLHQQKGRRTVALQRAATGASGLEASGSVAQVMADTRLMAELDAATIANNAAREAWGYEVQAFNYERGADVATARAADAVTSHLIGGAVNVGTTLPGIKLDTSTKR